MAISVKYFITDVNGNFIDWNQSIPGLSILGKEEQVLGSAGVDVAYVQAGSSANLSSLGGGNDKVYLTGNLAHYTQTIDQDTGIYTFTRTTGLSVGQTEVVKVTVSNENDVLYFADGHITLNAESDARLFDGTSFQSLQSGWLTAGGTPAAGPAERDTPTTASTPARVFITDAGGVDLPGLSQPGQRMVVSGSGGADSVYVKAGTHVDASSLGGGNDRVYLTGHLADYSQSIDQDTGVYTLTRTAGSLVEVVKVTLSNEDDVLYFANGHMVLNASTDARLFDGTAFQQLQTGWLTAGATPGTTANVVLSAMGAQNGTLNVGDTVTATVTYGEAMTVTGTPQLALDIGGTTVQANYNGGSGGTALTFTYVIQAGQADGDGIAVAADSLALNGGTIKNTLGTDATLAHAALGDNASLKVDTTVVAPVISIVASDDVISSAEAAGTITGTNEAGATVALSIGGVTRAATVTGTTWSYSLVAADITAMGQGAETLSATQTDLAGNVSLAGTRDITVSTVVPTVAGVVLSATEAQNSTLNAGDTVTATVTFSEAVTVSGTPQLALDIGGTTVQANYAAGSGSTALTFTYTILAGQTDATGIAVALDSLTLNGGTIKDAVGNDATLAHAALADDASFMVDTTASTVSSVVLSATGAQNNLLNTGDVVTATVTFSEAVTVTGTPRLALDIGGTTVQANYAAGSGSTALTFTYTVASGRTDANGIAVAANSLALNSGTIKDAAGNNATLTHAALADNASFMVDTTAPAAPTINTVATDNIIDSTEAASGVTVTGTAVANASVALTLVTGQVRTAVADGSGAWSYSLVAADIGFMGQGNKTLSATQSDPAGNVSTAGTRTITVSTSASTATVSSVAFSSATGIQNNRLNEGDTITTTVTFSEAVTVTGAPQLALLMGLTPVQASYVSGSGSTALTFTYTILAGQTDGNGLGVVANGLTLNGGSIKDSASNDVPLSHAAVASNINYIVDTTAPAAPVISIVAGDDIIDSVEAGSAITGTNETGATVALSIGGNTRAATVTGTTWSYNLVGADITAMGLGAETLSATQTDLAGNVSAAGTRAITVNATEAVVSVVGVVLSATGAQNSRLNAGDTVTATVTFSEAVTVTGTPRLALDIGGTTVQANYAAGSGSTALTFTYTILAGQTDANGIAVAANSLALNGGSIKNTAATDATLAHAALADNVSLMVDTTVVAPGISIVAGDDVISSVEAGGAITGTAEANASVALTLGAGNVRTVTADGAGAWSYSLVAADITAMGQGAETLSTTQTDLAGNVSLAGTRDITVSTVVPTVAGVVLSSATGAQNNTLNAGDVVTATVTFSEAVTVTGTPQLALNIGGTTVQASYAAGSGGTALTFTYTILAAQTDANGIAVAANSLALNGGSIKGGASNDATLTHSAVADNASFMVDTTAATVSSVVLSGATGAQNSTLNAGDTVTATVTFSEAVTVSGTPRLALDIGGTAVQANYAAGSGSTALTFTYTILAGQTDANGIAMGANKLTLNGGTATIRDAAGNNATLTHAAVADNASFMVDTTAHAAPTISTVAGNDIIDSTEAASGVSIAGTAVANASVALTLTAGQVRTVTADGSGNWSYSLVAADIGFMGQGAGKTLSATQSDPAGNVSAAVTRPITVSTSSSAATVSSVAFTSDSESVYARLNAGDTVTTTVTFSEAVTVTGTPQLALLMGLAPVQASYVSGSGGTALTFTYTILAGQTDGNGLGVVANSLTLNGGSIKDSASNDVPLTHAAVASNINYIVDTTAPAAPVISMVAGDDTIDSTEVFSSITGTNETGATVTLSIGGNTHTATVTGTTWSYSPTIADIAAMHQGGETLSATQTDQAGNVSAAGTRAITVSTGAIISMTPAGNQTLNLSLQDVLDFTSVTSGNTVADTIRITGNAGDSMNLQAMGETLTTPTNGSSLTDVDGSTLSVVTSSAGNALTNDVVIGGATYDVYQYLHSGHTVTLLVNTAVTANVI